MNKKKAVILLLLFIFLIIYPVNATITYSCCNNFQTSNGTLKEGFNTITGWVNVAGGKGNFTNDTINYVEGNQSILITADNATGISMNIGKTINVSFSRNINFWFYVHNSNTVNKIKFLVAPNSSASQYYYQEVINSSYHFNVGWNYVSFTTLTMTKQGSWDTNNLNYLRIYVTPEVGKIANVSIDNFRVDTQGKAKAIFTFDDGNNTISNITQIMTENGQVGTVFVIPPWIGTAGNLTLTDLNNLSNAGWDISSHSMSHNHINNLNTTEMDNELAQSKAWLVNNGFSKSAEIFAYPAGEWSETSIIEAKKYYLLSRLTDTGLYQPHIQNIGNITQTLRILYMINSTTEQSIKDKINATIAENGTVILTAHYFDNTSYLIDSRYMPISRFENISNYLASRSSDIDVIPLSDILITSVSPLTKEDNRNAFLDIAVTLFIAFLLIQIVIGHSSYGNMFLLKYVGWIFAILVALMVVVNI